MSEIQFYDFIKNKNIYHTSEKSYTAAVRFFVENNTYDIISYTITDDFYIFNTNFVHINYDGKPYIKYNSPRECDMLDNIDISSEEDIIHDIKYVIGGIIYTKDNFKEFIRIAAIYHDLTIEIEFKRMPLPTDKISVKTSSSTRI